MMVKNQKFNRLTLFSISFCGHAMQISLLFLLNHKNQKRTNTWRETERAKGCDGKQCDQNTAETYLRLYFNWMHYPNQRHKHFPHWKIIIESSHTATQHTKWFDIRFMCMIWCFASICITSRLRFLFLYFDLIECIFISLHLKRVLFFLSFFDFSFFWLWHGGNEAISKMKGIRVTSVREKLSK